MDQQQQTEVICTTCTETHKKAIPNSTSSLGNFSGFPYDFVILYSDTEKALFETFFTTLEQTYNLKGFHRKRDLKIGVLKGRHLVKTFEKSKFIIELISQQSLEDKSFQRLRSVAHEVECKKRERAHPEVLPIFVDVPREEQRSFTTTVGRSYVDKEVFWEELISYMLRLPSPASPKSLDFLTSTSSAQEEGASDVRNNNAVAEEDAAKVKYRRKHKVFQGLLQVRKKKSASTKASRRVRTSKKRGKQKSKRKGLKSLRRLLLCVPARSKDSQDHSSPRVTEEPMSMSPTPLSVPQSTARQDSLEDEHIVSTRVEISRA